MTRRYWAAGLAALGLIGGTAGQSRGQAPAPTSAEPVFVPAPVRPGPLPPPSQLPELPAQRAGNPAASAAAPVGSQAAVTRAAPLPKDGSTPVAAPASLPALPPPPPAVVLPPPPVAGVSGPTLPPPVVGARPEPVVVPAGTGDQSPAMPGTPVGTPLGITSPGPAVVLPAPAPVVSQPTPAPGVVVPPGPGGPVARHLADVLPLPAPRPAGFGQPPAAALTTPAVPVPASGPPPVLVAQPPSTRMGPAPPKPDTAPPGTGADSSPTLPAPAAAGGSSHSAGSKDGSAASPGEKAAPGEKKDGAAKKDDAGKGLTDSAHQDDGYGLKSLFDSLHQPGKSKAWYEKLSLRGYTQFRWGRSLHQEDDSAEPSLFNDRFINGTAENFYIRRARVTLSGHVSDYLYLYFQTDAAVTPPGTSTVSYFTQVRDLYGDVYLDKDKVHRLRVGISKVPFGWENLQSSQNRLPLERSNPINSAAPNERDLGVFYYWTPEEQQKLFKDLVDGGLKGSGNYGVFGAGVYNGQALPQLEQNHNLHAVARVTWPFRLPDGQVVEGSLQGYTGQYVVAGDEILPLGVGPELVPARTREDDHRGHLDQRVGASFIWYPQPFGFQAEWCVGRGPGLNDDQTAVVRRSLHGGYVQAMYKLDTGCHGIITPYARCQYYRGGYKSFANAPYGTHRELDLGVEWLIRREMELTVEYALIDGPSLSVPDEEGVVPYSNYHGGVLRVQFQINY